MVDSVAVPGEGLAGGAEKIVAASTDSLVNFDGNTNKTEDHDFPNISY